jgi:acetylornithine deacetylase/succinyl-diaminopimelate desuccinylase-like protein
VKPGLVAVLLGRAGGLRRALSRNSHLFSCAAALLTLAGFAQAIEPVRSNVLGGVGRNLLAIYRELVEIDTMQPAGDTTAAARAMAKHLLDAGYDAADVQVLEPYPRRGNLVARLRGTGEMKPLLLLAHLDVVPARKEDWSGNLDPTKLTERDGYFYGRGALDDKAMGSIFVANMARMKREGFRPKRDIILALTADEEAGEHNGVDWLVEHRRDLIDAELALNEGGTGTWRDGGAYMQGVQVSEKMYQSYALEATSAGGHSSLPERDNAIYELAHALDGVAALEFPAHLTDATRRYFGAIGATEVGSLVPAIGAVARGTPTDIELRAVSTIPRFNAQLRTTCVATRLEGGHADNALPARARAVVNCRLLPGEEPAFVHAQLQRAAGDRVKVTAMNTAHPSPPADLDSPAMRTIERVCESMWPRVPVVPLMSAGATDGAPLRNAGISVYGVSGIFLEHGENRMHGRDERIPVRSFFEAAQFLDRLARELAQGR